MRGIGDIKITLFWSGQSCCRLDDFATIFVFINMFAFL